MPSTNVAPIIRPFKARYIDYPHSSYTWTTYHDGNVCLCLQEHNNAFCNETLRLSVNMGENYMLRRGGVHSDFLAGNFDDIFIKSYSENEGVLEQLIAHSIVKVQKQVTCGFVELPLCSIIDPAYYIQNDIAKKG